MPGRKAKTFPVEELLNRLESAYGAPEYAPRYCPMDELVSCILSQHTSDALSFPTFEKLKAKYPSWQQVVNLGQEGLANEIKNAGLSNQKSKTIIASLIAIKDRTGDYSLESLRAMPMLDARKWLTSLPGVGPKTASIVICFALGMPAIPVDTHVYRVSRRLGIIPDDVNENKAHDLLLDMVPHKDAYRFHMDLIQHGRQTCKAPTPRCERCNVTDLCPWFKKNRARMKA